MREIIGYNGCIMQSDPRDWILGNSMVKEIPEITSQIRHEYNQLEFYKMYGRNLCTLYAPIGILSTLTQTLIESQDRQNLCGLRTKMPDFDPNYGGYLVEGVNCVRKWWNAKNTDAQVSQYSVNIHGEEFAELVAKGHRVNIGIKGNKAYNIDVSDGILDNTNIGNTTYGHSTTVRKLSNSLHSGIFIIDNYFGEKKYNIYGFRDFKEFIKSGLVYEVAYVFLKK